MSRVKSGHGLKCYFYAILTLINEFCQLYHRNIKQQTTLTINLNIFLFKTINWIGVESNNKLYFIIQLREIPYQ